MDKALGSIRFIILLLLTAMQSWFVFKAGAWVPVENEVWFLGAACYGKDAIDLFREAKGTLPEKRKVNMSDILEK